MLENRKNSWKGQSLLIKIWMIYIHVGFLAFICVGFLTTQEDFALFRGVYLWIGLFLILIILSIKIKMLREYSGTYLLEGIVDLGKGIFDTFRWFPIELFPLEDPTIPARDDAKRPDRPNGVVGKIKLSNYTRNIIILDKKECFKDDPFLPFDRAIIYVPDTLHKVVTWTKGVKRPIHEFNTRVALGRINLKLIDRDVSNRPMLFLTHARGMNYGISCPIFDPEEVEQEKELIAQQIYSELKEEFLLKAQKGLI